MKKFNEDHVKTSSANLHEFLISKDLEMSLLPDEVIDFDDLDTILIGTFIPFFNSERSYN